MSFNDDDYYLYWVDSKQIAAHYSCKNAPPVPLPGQAVARGMSAKYMGLWK